MKLIEKEELLPTHYTEVGEPSYTGKGNHSVIQLEEIAEQYKELVHQLRLREQAILNKFSIAIVSESDFSTELLEKEREAAESAFNQARKQTSILGEKDMQMTDYLISPKYKTFEDYWNSKKH